MCAHYCKCQAWKLDGCGPRYWRHSVEAEGGVGTLETSQYLFCTVGNERRCHISYSWRAMNCNLNEMWDLNGTKRLATATSLCKRMLSCSNPYYNPYAYIHMNLILSSLNIWIHPINCSVFHYHNMLFTAQIPNSGVGSLNRALNVPHRWKPVCINSPLLYAGCSLTTCRAQDHARRKGHMTSLWDSDLLWCGFSCDWLLQLYSPVVSVESLCANEHFEYISNESRLYLS